jgi:UDP-N-acetyl-D-glucosamine dehydrogenase
VEVWARHELDDNRDRLDLVVIGLGYVGLPLAQQAIRRGLAVAGYDLDADAVEGLNLGSSRVDDLSDADVSEMVASGFFATCVESVIGRADAVVICVPTPLDEASGPDLSAVLGATEAIARHLHSGQLVVLESTTYPGTTEDVVRPILERDGRIVGRDFYLAYSPERIDPGNPEFGVANIPKVVGGCDEASTRAAADLYGRFVEQVVEVKGTREAEMSKLLENTYRHVNIALVNEMAIFCHDLGVDLWEVIRAAGTKPFGFQAFYPGPGVGGHCIPIDPNYLSYKVRSLGYPFRFVELAQEISARMPSYVVDRIVWNLNERELPVRGTRILLLGVTYKKNIADDRESPVLQIAEKLLGMGADLEYHDPFIEAYEVGGSTLRSVEHYLEATGEAALTVFLQDHDAYDLDNLARSAKAVLDCRGRMEGPRVELL